MFKSLVRAVTIFLVILMTASAASALCGFDVNDDGAMGLEEAIFALQVVAGMKPNTIPLCEDIQAEAAIKNAYTAAMAYFTDYPQACVDHQSLISAGFAHPDAIQVTVIECSYDNLLISAHHVDGVLLYYIDERANITTVVKEQ